MRGWLKISFALLILAVLQLTLVPRLNPYFLQIINLIGINAIMAVSLNLITGFTGQFSLGHAGFMAIGAYSSAAVTVYLRDYFLNILSFLPYGLGETLFFLLALGFGGLLAALAGLLVGIPTLRLRGDYLAIATLGFGEIIRVVILNLDFVGGARGFGDIPEYANFFWIFLPLLFCVIMIYNLVNSTKGKALLAIREDEIASESIGINVTRYKVTAFLIGSFWAGVGGGLFAHLNTYLHTNSFGFMKSVEFVVMVVLGGMGSIVGSLAAAALLTFLPEVLRVASEFRMVLYSLLLIVLMIWRPQGILGKDGRR
jgi:branched-chain amino acid transport system permease protein